MIELCHTWGKAELAGKDYETEECHLPEMIWEVAPEQEGVARFSLQTSVIHLMADMICW